MIVQGDQEQSIQQDYFSIVSKLVLSVDTENSYFQQENNSDKSNFIEILNIIYLS